MHSMPQTTKTPEQQVWEKHYRISELVERWGYKRTTLQNWFRDEPGVLRHGESRLRRGRKRPYVSLRIPESVAVRVYQRHTEAI
jgi:hypothetical protein